MQAVRRGRFGPTSSLKRDEEVAHIEHVNIGPEDISEKSSTTSKQYPFVPESLSDEALPFIPKEVVLKRGKQSKSEDPKIYDKERQQDNEHWIVIDNIVFDCSEFALEHPGGEDVILSFVGEDCSWQFWRLHGKSVMDQYGRGLRVGRTAGIKNRFPESVRYVGLSKLGDEW